MTCHIKDGGFETNYPRVFDFARRRRQEDEGGSFANQTRFRRRDAERFQSQSGIELHLVHVFVDDVGAFSPTGQTSPFGGAQSPTEIS